MDSRLQRRVQRYGWDKAASHYERSWQSQLEPAQSALLELAGLKEEATRLEAKWHSELDQLNEVSRIQSRLDAART